MKKRTPTLQQAALLRLLSELVVAAQDAGYTTTLGFDLDSVLEHYERLWGKP